MKTHPNSAKDRRQSRHRDTGRDRLAAEWRCFVAFGGVFCLGFLDVFPGKTVVFSLFSPKTSEKRLGFCVGFLAKVIFEVPCLKTCRGCLGGP